ncbi:protein FANTASTIC FOUR 3-like [Trifolium pratense]|nr:protein FANTASTIC FOUR 3-like [Trifolium pratense]
MDILNEYLSSKVEQIASSLYNYTLRAKRSHNGGHCCHCYHCYHGLKTLVHLEEKNIQKRIIHSYNMSKTKTTTMSKDSNMYSSLWERLSKSLWSSSPGSPTLLSTVMGDLIGTESGDCMSCDLTDERLGQSQRSGFIVKEKKREKKVFPPAITLLRETGAGGMPSCFKKECGEDGRLILKSENMKCHCEYMEANRENGRLIMRMTHLDDNGWPIDVEEEEEEEEESDLEIEFEKELVKEGSSDVSKNESGSCWADLRQCASYGNGGFIRAQLEGSFYLGLSGSAPLPPITSVM